MCRGRVLLGFFVLALGACDTPADAPDGGDGLIHADAGRPLPDPPSRYPYGSTHSPITPSVAHRLRLVAQGGTAQQANVFAKVGDSITVASTFMGCFAGTQVDLAGRTALQDTLDFFKAGSAGGGSPYTRTSLAASVGKTAGWAITGTPSPLDMETLAIMPRYALVMYGTNDVGGGAAYLHTYAANLLTLVDDIVAEGIIPILSTIPPRDDSATVDALVPRYNEVVRAVAQGRQVPYLDYHKQLLPLPGHGLGPDGVHPNTYMSGTYQPCAFTAAGLDYGYNVRNLLSLEALARVRPAAEQGMSSDPEGPLLVGKGTAASPLVVDALPFVDLADTSRAGPSAFDRYSCDTSKNESGPEIVYQVTLASPGALRATVFVRGTVDVDVHLLSAASQDACLLRNDKEVFAPSLAAGTYYLVLDSYVPADGIPRAGEYMVAIGTE